MAVRRWGSWRSLFKIREVFSLAVVVLCGGYGAVYMLDGMQLAVGSNQAWHKWNSLSLRPRWAWNNRNKNNSKYSECGRVFSSGLQATGPRERETEKAM